MKETLFSELLETLGKYGQEHVLAHWGTLSGEEREFLATQLRTIDHGEMTRIARTHLDREKQALPPGSKRLEPAPVIELPATDDEKERRLRAFRMGEQIIARGKVGVFLVAGGQASRLGFDGPKGMFPVTPVRKKTLFELFAEKIMSLAGQYDVMIPWYIMTGRSNHRQTIEFFEKNVYFGLRRDGVKFFRQREIPAMTPKGGYILQSPSSLFMNPNGHGGSITALHESGALEDMKARGIEEIFYFQVDNPLAHIADPAFVGYHVMAGAQMSTKVVRKAYPGERVGVIGMIDGKPGVIEYSDLSTEEMTALTVDGRLKFDAGNIAIHLINRRFVEDLNRSGTGLPYHRAIKKMNTLEGEREGIKFEMFVFDALGLTERTVTMEVAREEEFAPVKNREGVDSPETARRMQIEMFASWLETAGVGVPRKESGEVDGAVEVDPLFALTKKEFVHYYREKPFLGPGFSLYIE